MKSSPLHLRFGDWTASVAVDDLVVRSRLVDYFRPFVLRTPTTALRNVLIDAGAVVDLPAALAIKQWDSRGKDSFGDYRGTRYILKNRTGVIIAGRDGMWRVGGDLRRNFPQLVNLICTLNGIAILDRGAAMLHASAAVRDGKAIAIVGESGTGKSSVMVRLLEHGFDFLTNDRLLLRTSNGIVGHGLPKLPRVNPGTMIAGAKTRALLGEAQIRRYERLAPAELRRLEEKRDLDVRGALGRAWMLKAPMAAAFVLARGEGHAGIERLEPGQTLDALRVTAKTFGAFDRNLARRTDGALLQVAQELPVYRLTARVDPQELADLIAGSKDVGNPNAGVRLLYAGRAVG